MSFQFRKAFSRDFCGAQVSRCFSIALRSPCTTVLYSILALLDPTPTLKLHPPETFSPLSTLLHEFFFSLGPQLKARTTSSVLPGGVNVSTQAFLRFPHTFIGFYSFACLPCYVRRCTGPPRAIPNASKG